MSEAQAIVEQILNEHKAIDANFKTLGRISSDIEAVAQLKSGETKDYFVPKSLDDEGRGLLHWKQLLRSIDEGLKAHFHKEETALTNAIKQEGTPEQIDALQKLLAEHDDINQHIAKLIQDAEDIAAANSKIEVWEGSGWGMKVNIERFKDMLMAHAERERELLSRVKDYLSRKN